MMMFGPRLNTVFASRWKALFWAGSVMVSAYFMVPHAKEDANPAQPDPSAAEAASAVAQISGGEAPVQNAPAASPWAK